MPSAAKYGLDHFSENNKSQIRWLWVHMACK